MKVTKWICRYGFFAVLLALAVLWCVKCQITIDQLEAKLNSPEYIDMVVDHFEEAVALKEEAEVFRGHRLKGFIGCGAIGGLLVLLILWHIFGDKLVSKVKALFAPKPKKEKMPKVVKQKAVVVQTPPKFSGYCTACGKYYEELPAFCEECGAKIEL